MSSEWLKHYLEHNFRGKLVWCTLPSILEPEKVHFCPSVSTQEAFSQVTAQAQLGICPEWSFLGEQSLHEDRFLFSSPALGLPKCKNLRQVPLSMACNSSWGLPSGLCLLEENPEHSQANGAKLKLESRWRCAWQAEERDFLPCVEKWGVTDPQCRRGTAEGQVLGARVGGRG